MTKSAVSEKGRICRKGYSEEGGVVECHNTKCYDHHNFGRKKALDCAYTFVSQCRMNAYPGLTSTFTSAMKIASPLNIMQGNFELVYTII